MSIPLIPGSAGETSGPTRRRVSFNPEAIKMKEDYALPNGVPCRRVLWNPKMGTTYAWAQYLMGLEAKLLPPHTQPEYDLKPGTPVPDEEDIVIYTSRWDMENHHGSYCFVRFDPSVFPAKWLLADAVWFIDNILYGSRNKHRPDELKKEDMKPGMTWRPHIPNVKPVYNVEPDDTTSRDLPEVYTPHNRDWLEETKTSFLERINFLNKEDQKESARLTDENLKQVPESAEKRLRPW
jgi:hypothetical protein